MSAIEHKFQASITENGVDFALNRETVVQTDIRHHYDYHIILFTALNKNTDSLQQLQNRETAQEMW